MVESLGKERQDIPTSELQLNRKNVHVVARTANGGEFRIEDGDSGTWIVFDGDCLDMLPFCRAHCCGLTGTFVDEESQERLAQAYGEEVAEILLDFHQSREGLVMKRCADGRCIALDRDTHLCSIYENRPFTCSNFHCSRGSGQRGFPLPNHMVRQWNP